MNNRKLAETFHLFADLLEFKGENPFKLRAYRNASRAIKELSEEVADILKDENRKLTDIDGIGKAVAEKSEVLINTGKLPQLEELRAEIPDSVLGLLRIPSLGPKKAAVLFNELGIRSLDQLKAACEAGEVRGLKGFGAKTEKSILDGMEIAEAAEKRIYWARADELASRLRKHLSTEPAIKQLELAGSYRRGKETVGDLDFLVVSDDHESVMRHFGEFEDVSSVIGQGETKMSVRMDNGFQVDLRVVPAESFGAALQYFTGSKEHNVVVRGRARSMGLKVNEWGVFRADNDEYVAGTTEQEVYEAVGLEWIPPELRESRGEFDWAEGGQAPELITVDDICGDLHMHTVATDGKATLEEMIAAAQKRGLDYIAITDHSKRVSMANGLDEDRLLDQWERIDEINSQLDGSFRVLKGIECDILEKGGMDLSDVVLAQADWVLASVHYGQQQSRETITARILGAVENPHVDAIAHPTGRLINRREAYEVDMNAVMDAVVEHGKCLELNANPARLDLNDLHCAEAKRRGIPIVINTDAHDTRGLDVIRYGILQARRGGLTSADVLNSLSCDDFLAKIASS